MKRLEAHLFIAWLLFTVIGGIGITLLIASVESAASYLLSKAPPFEHPDWIELTIALTFSYLVFRTIVKYYLLRIISGAKTSDI